MKPIAYLRVSTEEQGESGAGLAAQTKAIGDACKQRGIETCRLESEIISGSTPAEERPVLRATLEMLRAGEYDCLIVAKLDRLSRSAFDFASLMRRSLIEGWAIICLDLGVDTATPSGKMIAQVMSAFAEFELDMIRARTRDALRAKKAAGVKLGRKVDIPQHVIDRIVRLRGERMSWAEIARTLTAQGVPPPRGGKRWYYDVIRAAYIREQERGNSGNQGQDDQDQDQDDNQPAPAPLGSAGAERAADSDGDLQDMRGV